MNTNDVKNKNEPHGTPKETDAEKDEKKTGFFRFIRNHPVFTMLLLGMISVAAVYLWKDTEVNREKSRIEKEVSLILQAKNQEMLQWVGKPLVWYIRSEMLSGDFEQINLFMSDLVKEKNIQFIHLIDPDGMIILSTNKKLEGQSSAQLFESEFLNVETITVVPAAEQVLMLVAPVMGFDRKLATLIFAYKAENTIPDL